MHDPHESSVEHHDFNVVGLQKVLEYVEVYKIPKLVHFVEELPRNASGKLLKRVLRDQIGN